MTFTILLFLAGFLPVAGQSVVPVLGALGRRRMLAIGLGLPAALLCLIPLAAIVVMPVAFADGVLVALDALGLEQPGKQRRPALPFD